MTYKPRGWPYLIRADRARIKRQSARHLRNLTNNYTTEENWVNKYRSTAKKLDKQASKLEKKLK